VYLTLAAVALNTANSVDLFFYVLIDKPKIYLLLPGLPVCALAVLLLAGHLYYGNAASISKLPHTPQKQY